MEVTVITEVANGIVRIGPMTITDREMIELARNEFSLLRDLAPNPHRFKDALSGVETRITFVCKNPYRLATIRIVGETFVALSSSEEFAGMLRSKALSRSIVEYATEYATVHPEDVIHVPS
jgi:hypothetical protein